MSCEHLIYKPTDRAHVLPCRHKFCIPCTEGIQGLMESEIFSCPLCGNYSQYVDPHRSVFGEEKPPVNLNEGESMDHSTSSSNMPETVQLQADSCGGAATNTRRRPMSDREDRRDPDRGVNMWMAKTGVQKQAFEIDQREAWEMLEKDKQDRHYERHSTTPSGASQTSQVATLATNDGRRSPSDPSSESFRKNHRPNSERNGGYDNYAIMEKPHASTRGKPKSGYNEEGRCLDHDRFIAFACNECNSLLCQLCMSVHGVQYSMHTVSRLTDEEELHSGPPKMSLDSKEGAKTSVSDDQNCEHHLMPFVMYCKNCKRMLCKKCLESHPRYCHSYYTVSIRDMKQSMNAKFKEHLDTIDSLKGKLEMVSQTVEQNLARLLEEADTVKDNVKKSTDEAIKQLLENQEVMMKQIESEVKKKTAKYQTCADETGKMTEILTTLKEAAQGAFETVDDSNFPLAQIVEQEVSRNIGQLEGKCKIYEPTATREKIELQCEVKRIEKYWEHMGDRSEAPVRLIKPTTFFGRSYFY
ncbi:Protein wech [Holothuria leucospilota]|uniref:Protein wech n=1 Tax=Holothuria leucospilota TaxID=206669 RepID=A0A9Q1CPV3_HOLLE|nr:Protein wech [Holothuria leucospilota]